MSQPPSPEQQNTERIQKRTLHPATLLVPLLDNLRSAVVPAVFALFWISLSAVLLIVFWAILLPATIYHLLRYLSFSYRLDDHELRIRSGLIWRRERRIPLSRIQDTRIHRGVFHRLLGVAQVEITTAASEHKEAILNVVGMGEATRFATSVSRSQNRTQLPDSADTGSVERPDSLLTLSCKDLILGGLTSRLMASLLTLVGLLLYFGVFLRLASAYVPSWPTGIPEWERWVLPDQAGGWTVLYRILDWDDTLLGSLLLAMFWLLFSILRFVTRYWGFRLTRSGSVLTRQHGLFSLRSSNLAWDRVQAMMIEEGLLRRWFGLASVWADSGGDRREIDDDGQRPDAFVPVASRHKATQLAAGVLAGLSNPEPAWQRVSEKAIWRQTRVGWAVLLLTAFLVAPGVGWLVTTLVPFFPAFFFVSLQQHRNTGYWLDANYLMWRRGWFNRRTLILPVRNLQNLSVTQTPFDRRLGLATLNLDTAGQSTTGGGIAIRNLPCDEAFRIQQRLSRRIAVLPLVRWAPTGPGPSLGSPAQPV